MKLSEFYLNLDRVSTETFDFVLEDGTKVPAHYHITEVGLLTRDFIDCGGVVRKEQHVNFQLYTAEDFDHRMTKTKLRGIMQKTLQAIALPDAEIKIEYQMEKTIGVFFLDFNGTQFILKSTETACLAKDACGIPEAEEAYAKKQEQACTPGSGCC